MRGMLQGCVLLAALLVVGCGPEARPRPETFARIELPERRYVLFQDARCPCTFEYPAYGQVKNLKNDSCDFDIVFPPLGSTWHISNRPIRPGAQGRGTRSDLYETYRRLLFKHAQKATAIVERPLRVPAGGGVFFELSGQVPTSGQVFVTDSVRHAFVIASYFNTASRNDSLAPVIHYQKADLRHAAHTLRWR